MPLGTLSANLSLAVEVADSLNHSSPLALHTPRFPYRWGGPGHPVLSIGQVQRPNTHQWGECEQGVPSCSRVDRSTLVNPEPVAAGLVAGCGSALGSAGQVGTGIDQLGDGVSVRRWATGAVLALGVVVFTPATASAEPPSTTPGQSGVQGCRENGQAISGAASGPGAFGQQVRGAAPIADENAAFFTALCSEG
jgi:hypothetical protein